MSSTTKFPAHKALMDLIKTAVKNLNNLSNPIGPDYIKQTNFIKAWLMALMNVPIPTDAKKSVIAELRAQAKITPHSQTAMSMERVAGQLSL